MQFHTSMLHWSFMPVHHSSRKFHTMMLYSVLRIRDVYPGSVFFPSWIQDPNLFFPGSRIRIKEFKNFNPKKWFLSTQKLRNMIRIVHPGSGSWFFTYPGFRLPDPGVKQAPSPGSATMAVLVEISLPDPEAVLLPLGKAGLPEEPLGSVALAHLHPLLALGVPHLHLPAPHH